MNNLKIEYTRSCKSLYILFSTKKNCLFVLNLHTNYKIKLVSINWLEVMRALLSNDKQIFHRNVLQIVFFNICN